MKTDKPALKGEIKHRSGDMTLTFVKGASRPFYLYGKDNTTIAAFRSIEEVRRQFPDFLDDFTEEPPAPPTNTNFVDPHTKGHTTFKTPQPESPAVEDVN